MNAYSLTGAPTGAANAKMNVAARSGVVGGHGGGCMQGHMRFASGVTVTGDAVSGKAASAVGSDAACVTAPSNLFQKQVDVRIRSQEREERTEKLCVSVNMNSATRTKPVKVLELNITSEEDPYFLHSLTVSEEDFTVLKAEQGIIVDFATFPLKFIELLEECISSAASGRFLAVLNLSRGDSTFSIVEANQFRHLAHITLSFRPGNDASIKQYLAGRVLELKKVREDLCAKLSQTETHLQGLQADFTSQSAELRNLQVRLSSSEREHIASNASALADAKHSSMREMEEMKAGHERHCEELMRRHTAQMDALLGRNEELDGTNKSLTASKYELENKVAELTAKLNSSTDEVKSLRAEGVNLKEENRALDSLKHEHTKGLTEYAVRVSGMEQALKDREEMGRVLQQRLDDAEAHRAAIGDALEQTRSTAASAEERATIAAAEIDRGNQIIEKLQTELREARAKLKLQKSVFKQQETAMAQKQEELEKHARGEAAVKQLADGKTDEIERLRSIVDDQKSKLHESQELLKSNQQMIQWLNSQITEAQLGKVGGSRYSFRTSMATTLAGKPGGDILGVHGN